MEISKTQKIAIESYDYDLPDHRIAKYPLTERDSSKLLIYRGKEISDAIFKDLPTYLSADSLMVFNNTKVIQARLLFSKETGAQIEIFCLEPYSPSDYLSSFQQVNECTWLCLVGNSKKWKEGALTLAVTIGGKELKVSAERLGRVKDANEIKFSWDNPQITFADILDAVGELPIPPYLNRKTEESDLETYQTVYSKIIGSVAAPTAGLHFTGRVFEALENKGITKQELTLHVGAGTFKPVQSAEIGQHEMHAELISVRKDFLEALIGNKGQVVAVGTTSVRTLESLYYLGVILKDKANYSSDLFVSQWMPYADENNNLSVDEALQNIIKFLDEMGQETLLAHTAIMIAPGYQFKIVDALVTNFHQPKSTLLLLVSCFVGEENWKSIYNHALKNDYRFLSYGDSSLLFRK